MFERQQDQLLQDWILKRARIPVIGNDWDTYDKNYDELERKYWNAHDKIVDKRKETLNLINRYKSQKIESQQKDAMEILRTRQSQVVLKNQIPLNLVIQKRHSGTKKREKPRQWN